MNKQFVITQNVSVGKIEFGMERTKVREILGECSEYRNRQEDDNTADCFDICQVFYSKNNTVEFIMFHTLDKIDLVWDKKILTSMSKFELISFFLELDKDLFIEDYGHGTISIESNTLGVACYFGKNICFHNDGNEFDKVETISIGIKDYWLKKNI